MAWGDGDTVLDSPPQPAASSWGAGDVEVSSNPNEDIARALKGTADAKLALGAFLQPLGEDWQGLKDLQDRIQAMNPGANSATERAPEPGQLDVQKGIERTQIPAVGPEIMRTANAVTPMGMTQEIAAHLFPQKQVRELLKGSLETQAGLESGLTSPMNLAMLGTAGGGKVAQTALAAGFEAQAIKNLPEQWDAFQKADNLAEKSKLVGDMTLGLGLPLLGAAHLAFAKEAGVPVKPEPKPVADAVKAEPIPEPVPINEPSPTRTAQETAGERTGPVPGPGNEPTPSDAVSQTRHGTVSNENLRPGRTGVTLAPDESAGQQPPPLPRAPGVEGPGAGEAVSPERQNVGVAERYVEAEAPGTVIPGERQDSTYWRSKGREFIDAGGDPRMPVRAAAAGHTSPRNVGIVSAEFERLSLLKRQAADALEAAPGNPQAQADFQKASDAWKSWRQEMQPVLTRAGESLAAVQGELPVDLTTFDGLHTKALELNGGKELTPGQKATLIKRGQVGKRVRTAERQSVDRLEAELDRTYGKRATPTEAEMSAAVEKMVERMTPCR